MAVGGLALRSLPTQTLLWICDQHSPATHQLQLAREQSGLHSTRAAHSQTPPRKQREHCREENPQTPSEGGALSPKARILPPRALFPALPRAGRSVPGAQPSREAPRSMATDAKVRQAEAAAQAPFLLPHIQQRARSVLYPGRKGRLRLEHPAPPLSICHPRSGSGLHRCVSAPLGTASPRTASCWNSPAPVFWGRQGRRKPARSSAALAGSRGATSCRVLLGTNLPPALRCGTGKPPSVSSFYQPTSSAAEIRSHTRELEEERAGSFGAHVLSPQ